MLIDYHLGQTSIVLRVKVRNSSVATGAGLTGLTNASSGLVIGTIADNESSSTAYTAAGSTIDTITTLGTFAAPTAAHCRFKEVDSTNHKGIYEIQLDNARYAVSNAKSLLISISGATNAAECDVCIPLRQVDPYSAASFMTGVGGLAPPANWNLMAIDGSGRVTVGTNADKTAYSLTQAFPSNFASLAITAGGAVTVGTNNDKTGYALSSGQQTALAAAVWQDAVAGDFTVANSAGKQLMAAMLAASYAAPPTAAQNATAVWTDLLASSDFSTASSIGALLKTDVDAAISSRSTYAGADTAGTTTLLTRLSSTRATNLDNLDAAVSTRLATSGYTAPPTTAQIATAILTDTGDEGTSATLGKLVGQLTDMIQATGQHWQFTTTALALAPSGGSSSVLASNGLDGIVIETGGTPATINARQALSVILAESAGNTTGANTDNPAIKAAGNPAVTRIVATIDAAGNRSNVLSPPA